jgi:hypothetical protein
MNAFVHSPCAPQIHSFNTEKRFSGLNQKTWLSPSKPTVCSAEKIRVSRFNGLNEARILIATNSTNSTSSMAMDLSASELRELAQRLLDAAHDIDTNPAPQAEVKSEGAPV